MLKYYLIHKPYGMLSQFSREVESHITLADLDYAFDKDIYPVGRLDKDSEGLLILTNDKKLTDKLLNPKNKHIRSYWVQVEGIPSAEALQKLQRGVEIKIKKKIHKCLPLQAKIIEEAPAEERDPPVRFRKEIPTTWLNLKLTEGKNRQVRRMTAKAGHPTLRLLRNSIENLQLGDLRSGEVKEIGAKEIYQLLKLNKIR